MNQNLLKGKIVANGYTQSEMAKILEITPKTFGEKLKKGVFTNKEMKTMGETLHLNEKEFFLIFM